CQGRLTGLSNVISKIFDKLTIVALTGDSRRHMIVWRHSPQEPRDWLARRFLSTSENSSIISLTYRSYPCTIIDSSPYSARSGFPCRRSRTAWPATGCAAERDGGSGVRGPNRGRRRVPISHRDARRAARCVGGRRGSVSAGVAVREDAHRPA